MWALSTYTLPCEDGSEHFPYLAVDRNKYIQCKSYIFTTYILPMLTVQYMCLTSTPSLQSIVSHSDPLMEDHSLIVKTKELFLYGEREIHQQDFRRLRVNGLIVDGKEGELCVCVCVCVCACVCVCVCVCVFGECGGMWVGM